MGFRKPQKTEYLSYEGTEYEGAHVKVNLSVPLRTYFEIDGLLAGDDQQALFEKFVTDCIIEWDLEEEDGSPTPLTLEGLMGWPPQFALMTIKAWLELVGNPPAPLVPEQVDNLNLGNYSRPNS